MTVGDPKTFALESGISRAFEQQGALALGFFVIHLGGRSFGVRKPDATLLACSHKEVGDRVARRGRHTAPFVIEAAGEIADAVRDVIYAPEDAGKRWFGFLQAELAAAVYSGHLLWAPDGDEAFDDGSCVLHFDAGKQVRLIGFRSRESDWRHDPATLADVWIDSDVFYEVLGQWRARFDAEWRAMPKSAETDSN